MRNLSILIVEDEAIIAEDLAVKVRNMGYEVAGTTATGEEAVDLARRWRPELILMDIRLAGAMDGIEAALEIHRERDIPVLFLTANIDRKTVERAQEAEAFGYILKPFIERDLCIQIRMALHKHAAVRRLRESEERLAGINRVLKAALTCSTEKELGLTCLEIVRDLTQSPLGLIWGLDLDGERPPGGGTTMLVSCDPVLSFDERKLETICQRIPRDSTSILTNQPAKLAGVAHRAADLSPLTALLAVPLLRDGERLGILAAGKCQGGYDEAEQQALEALAPSMVEAFLRKRVEQQLQAMNSELEQRVELRTRELQETQLQYLHAEKLTAIGKLSASIAHEFNNPLQAIMYVFKGLQKRATMEDEDRELLAAAVDECERMKNLIRSLQDFNRPSSGKRTWLDVHKVLDSLLLLHKSDFKSRRIKVKLEYAERLPQIHGVPDQIKQVFLNLLTNAGDACIQPGGLITVRTWCEDGRVLVAIKDTGIGIKAEHIGKIFEPFYTTKAAVKGTGLGLSVCHGIVQSHRGEIRVDSREGEGATFTVVLPIGESDDLP